MVGDSMECDCYLRKIQDKLSFGKTPCERGFGMPFKGSATPFRAVVEYHPISEKDQSRLHQFGTKVLPGLFLGNALYAGVSGKDIMVADIEELEQMDVCELHARRLNAKEVSTPRSGNFIFPVADRTVKIFGAERHLRTSTLTRHRPERDEEEEILPGMSDELDSPTELQDNSTRDDEEAKNDFWTITGEFIYRHHVVPRVKLYMPKGRNISYSDEVHRRYQNDSYIFGCVDGEHIEHFRNVAEEKELSDAWTGFTRFILLNERPPDGYTFSGETYKKTNYFSS